MSIRIKRHDKNVRLPQPVDVAGLGPAPPPQSWASVAALQTGFRVSGGSAYTLSASTQKEIGYDQV